MRFRIFLRKIVYTKLSDMEKLTIVTKTAVHQAVLNLMRLVKRHRITPISLFSVYNSRNYCKDSLRLIQAYDIFLKSAFFFCLICVNYIRNIRIWIDYPLERVPLSSTHTPSVQHIGSTLEPHAFNNQNPSVQHQKPSSRSLFYAISQK